MAVNRKLQLFLVSVCVASSLFGCTKGSALDGSGESPIDQSLVINDPALALVERFNMGSNLEQMANQVAKSTHTYGAVIEKHGATSAPLVIAQEIKKLLPDYQPRWNKNLANAYASQLSNDELRSLAVDGKQSPYASKFQDAQTLVGEDMRNNSMPILTELVTKGLTNAIK